jgi:hypothetical protein
MPPFSCASAQELFTLFGKAWLRKVISGSSFHSQDLPYV